MMTNELKGLLGLCRRAGKIAVGHDAAVGSVKSRKSFLAFTCSDSSQRLKREISDECSFKGRNIRYVDADFTMEELSLAIGTRAGVVSIDDRNFADKLNNLITGGYEYDKKI